MAEFSLKILDREGNVLAQGMHTLLYDAEYQSGDVVELTVPQAGHYVICLEDTLGEELVYLKQLVFRWGIPFDEGRISYNPRAFVGQRHYLSVRSATKEEIALPRNLAKNVYDCHGNESCFPHAWANVETRGESVFAARNAIDGVIYPWCHGRYPFESWGINKREDACWWLEFGRDICADTLVLTTRADFPHDAWWTSARLKLSNGTEMVLPLQKTAEGQKFDLHGATISWLILDHLVKADDPSPFPALTQVQVFGHEL